MAGWGIGGEIQRSKIKKWREEKMQEKITKKTSKAQAEANKRWAEKNRERTRYLRARNEARGFIRNRATADDLEELKQLIKARELQL